MADWMIPGLGQEIYENKSEASFGARLQKNNLKVGWEDKPTISQVCQLDKGTNWKSCQWPKLENFKKNK